MMQISCLLIEVLWQCRPFIVCLTLLFIFNFSRSSHAVFPAVDNILVSLQNVTFFLHFYIFIPVESSTFFLSDINLMTLFNKDSFTVSDAKVFKPGKPCVTDTHWPTGRVQRWLPPTIVTPVRWKATPSDPAGRSADRPSRPPSPSGCTLASCQTALEWPEEKECHVSVTSPHLESTQNTNWIVELCHWYS